MKGDRAFFSQMCKNKKIKLIEDLKKTTTESQFKKFRT